MHFWKCRLRSLQLIPSWCFGMGVLHYWFVQLKGWLVGSQWQAERCREVLKWSSWSFAKEINENQNPIPWQRHAFTTSPSDCVMTVLSNFTFLQPHHYTSIIKHIFDKLFVKFGKYKSDWYFFGLWSVDLIPSRTFKFKRLSWWSWPRIPLWITITSVSLNPC